METIQINPPQGEQNQAQPKEANLSLPTRGEINRALTTAQNCPEELTDRELWILEETDCGQAQPQFDQDYWLLEEGGDS